MGIPRAGVPDLLPSMASHRYDVEIKSEEAMDTVVARRPATVQVQVGCAMHDLHTVTPLQTMSEADWQCVRLLVTETPAQRFCMADFRPLFCLCQALLQHQPEALKPAAPVAPAAPVTARLSAAAPGPAARGGECVDDAERAERASSSQGPTTDRGSPSSSEAKQEVLRTAAAGWDAH